MRVRIVAAVLLATCGAGCSLLLSTSDLGGDQSAAPDAAASADAPGGGSDGDATTTNDAPADIATEEAAAGYDPSLLGFWKMDSVNASLIVADETGRGHDMVLSANMLDAMAGHRGGALVFAGSADSARVFTLENDDFPKSGTLSIWFTRSWVDNDTAGGRGLFDNWDNTRSHLFIRRVNTSGAGEIQFALQPASSSYAWGGNGQFITKDQWTHLVFTWDTVNAVASVYVDGVVAATGPFDTATSFTPSQQIFRLGEYWDGKIDEVRVYDRVLAATEITMIP